MELHDIPLLQGLAPALEAEVAGAMRPRRLDAGELLFAQGDTGTSLYVVRRGVAEVSVAGADGEDRVLVGLVRAGDVVGEMSLLTGEPRSAQVRALVATEVLELQRDAFTGLLARQPELVTNLTRILSQRLVRANARPVQAVARGEAVAVVVEDPADPQVAALVEAARRASPRPVATLDPPAPGTAVDDAVAALLPRLDELLAEHGTVLVLLRPADAALVAHCDRAVVVGDQLSGAVAPGRPVQVVPSGGGSAATARSGRVLVGTRLGLALGAGGAKGYAHLGALQVIEDAGYTVDAVSGSSIGAIVGACVAMGMRAAEIQETFRRTFTPETVTEMLTLSFTGTSAGVLAMERICRELTDGRTFDDLELPLSVMCVDLNSRLPAAITEGPLDEALIAATALAGLFPPRVHGDKRLVDGLALVPVPVDAVRAAGADVAVAVNIMSRDTLPAWPGEPPPDPQPPGRSRILEVLLEVSDVAQLDASVRHAATADVVVTPRFGPSTWRDFHLADQFTTAGVLAAEEQLPTLAALARPHPSHTDDEGARHGRPVHAG